MSGPRLCDGTERRRFRGVVHGLCRGGHSRFVLVFPEFGLSRADRRALLHRKQSPGGRLPPPGAILSFNLWESLRPDGLPSCNDVRLEGVVERSVGRDAR